MQGKHDEPIGFTVEGVLGLAGGRAEVGRRLGVSLQALAKWSRRIPAKYAREVAIMAGLPLAIVRPDMVRESPASYESDR